MKLLTIAAAVAMIALLPGLSHAMAGNHGKRGGPGGGAGEYVGPTVAPNAGPDAPAPVSVPEPGSFLLLASGLSTLGGLMAGKCTPRRSRRSGSSDLSRKASPGGAGHPPNGLVQVLPRVRTVGEFSRRSDARQH